MSLTLMTKPLSPVDEQLVSAAREFAREHIRPHAENWEQTRTQPKILRTAIRQFTPYYLPKELGGKEASKMTLAMELEELAAADYGFTFGFEVHNHATMVAAMSENTDARDRYLPKLMDGTMVGAFLLTEPTAGSEASAIRTTARESEGGWIINGEKAWITNAASADLLLVFAQAGETSKDIMCFFVERDSPGVELLERYDMSGAHAMGTGAFRFTDCFVPESQVAFPKGQAYKTALGGISFARFAVAAMCNGAYRDCLESAIDYANNRIQFGKPISKLQGVQFKLADELTMLEASRLLTFQAARMLDEGKDASTMVAHCKKFASRAAFDGVNHAMQCMGSNGLKRSYPMVRQMTALSIAFNTDGTNEICNIVIGKTF